MATWLGCTRIMSRNSAPWYILISDGEQTQAFGVKTGASSDLLLAGFHRIPGTRDGHQFRRMGVLLGERNLHAADIVTTENRSGRKCLAY